MKRHILARGVAEERIAVIPNWADTTTISPQPSDDLLREAWRINDGFVVMYSGNLGLSQNLENILLVAEKMRDAPVRFVLVGDGAAKAGLMAHAAAAKLGNVRFVPYQPKEKLARSLCAADLHLIPMRRGLAGYMVPSKFYGILAAGRPYIAAVDSGGEVAAITARYRTGVRIEPDSPDAMLEAIGWCMDNPAELKAMSSRCRCLAEMRFNRRASVELFGAMLRGLSPKAGRVESAREAEIAAAG